MINKTEYMIEKLQKRLETCIIKQRNHLKRYGTASEKLDKEEIRCISIINDLRKGEAV